VLPGPPVQALLADVGFEFKVVKQVTCGIFETVKLKAALT
jgi:hypothetical protein